MRRVKEHEPVQMFKFIDGFVIAVPDGIVDYFGLSAKMLWFAGCKRTKKKVVLTFVAPTLPSPRDPTPHPPLTSSIRGEFKRKKYKKQKQPFTLIKEMEALRKKKLKKKNKEFKPDWFG